MPRRKLDLVDGDAVTVADIMVTPVRTVAPDLPVQALVRIFLSEQITGAPVVDDGGRLVGVVSSSDVIQALAGGAEIPLGDTLRDDEPEADAESGEDPQATLLGYFRAPGPPATLAPPPVEGPVLADLVVADIMTAATFAIAPDATVTELAAFLARGRIHRSLVVQNGALRGIVTSSDIVRLVAGDAARERRTP